MSNSAGQAFLGIETSCDETATAIVRADGTVLASSVASQLPRHAPFGGVVPEIAARAHVEKLDHLVESALQQSGMRLVDLDGVAVTAGPGLIGGLMVGTVTAAAIAEVNNQPFFAINHLEAHALTARLTHGLKYPFLALLISGGHCQFVAVLAPRNYRLLGTTIDDSIGEAFDKISKMLGLGYPGGPAVEDAASSGRPNAFALPRPLLGADHCDFSFSGLKTAVRLQILDSPAKFHERQVVSDICASFQTAVGDILVDRSRKAIVRFGAKFGPPTALVMSGGVAANAYLRSRIIELSSDAKIPFVAPPVALCGDNATMVAWAAIEIQSVVCGQRQPMQVRARWRLSEMGR